MVLLWCIEVVKLCFVHFSWCNVVTLLCCLVSSFAEWFHLYVFLTSLLIPSSSNRALLTITDWLNWFLNGSQLFLFPVVQPLWPKIMEYEHYLIENYTVAVPGRPTTLQEFPAIYKLWNQLVILELYPWQYWQLYR